MLAGWLPWIDHNLVIGRRCASSRERRKPGGFTMNGRFVAAAFLALAVLGSAWMFRYDAKDSGDGTFS